MRKKGTPDYQPAFRPALPQPTAEQRLFVATMWTCAVCDCHLPEKEMQKIDTVLHSFFLPMHYECWHNKSVEHCHDVILRWLKSDDMDSQYGSVSQRSINQIIEAMVEHEKEIQKVKVKGRDWKRLNLGKLLRAIPTNPNAKEIA
jgi:hypothetical protein